MTPGAIIAVIRDVVILVALGLLIWLLVSFGSDRVKVADMKALQKQITANVTTEAIWRKEQTDANTQRDTDLAKVAAAIAMQRTPIILRSGPPRACPVSQTAASSPSQPAGPGSPDTGSGIDLRPQINRFELRLEALVADCRAALGSWPQ